MNTASRHLSQTCMGGTASIEFSDDLPQAAQEFCRMASNRGNSQEESLALPAIAQYNLENEDVSYMNRHLPILLLVVLALALALFGCSGTNPSVPRDSRVAIVYTYKVVGSYPHDSDACTQGLVFDNGVLYEGTGLYGRSSLRKVDLERGEVLQTHNLPEQYFGEGITIYRDEIFQLTWQSNVGFIYDKQDFSLLGEFNYDTEGWGMTNDGKRLIMSDGTSTLHFLDPDSLKEIKRIEVYDLDGPVNRLNELEYVKGEIYANIWQTNRIARINPTTGQVDGWIDLTGILNPQDVINPVDVLNGIAYDSKNGRLFVTGKLWPKLFEIELIPK